MHWLKILHLVMIMDAERIWVQDAQAFAIMLSQETLEVISMILHEIAPASPGGLKAPKGPPAKLFLLSAYILISRSACCRLSSSCQTKQALVGGQLSTGVSCFSLHSNYMISDFSTKDARLYAGIVNPQQADRPRESKFSSSSGLTFVLVHPLSNWRLHACRVSFPLVTILSCLLSSYIFILSRVDCTR